MVAVCELADFTHHAHQLATAGVQNRRFCTPATRNEGRGANESFGGRRSDFSCEVAGDVEEGQGVGAGAEGDGFAAVAAFADALYDGDLT